MAYRKSWRILQNGLLSLLLLSLESCYQYRVLNTRQEAGTEYQKKMLWSYAWGLVNKPQNFIVPNCDSAGAMDEVVFRTNLGYSLIQVVSLGIVAPIQVQWKCHKPCPRDGGL